MNEWGLKGTSAHLGYLVPLIGFFFVKWCLPLLKNNGKACERRKSGRERAEPSYPKMTKGSFRCMVSIDRSTHPHFFYKASRVPRWRRVAREVPTPIAHSRCAPCGVLSIHQTIYLSNHLAIEPSIYRSNQLSIKPAIYQIIKLYIEPAIYVSNQLSTYQTS